MARKAKTPPATQADSAFPDIVECMDCRCDFDLGETVHWTKPKKERGTTQYARCKPCNLTRANLGYLLKKTEDSHSWFKENVVGQERRDWIVKNRLNKELRTAITDTFTEVGATTAITALSSEVV